MKKKLLLTLATLFLFTIKVEAASICSYKEQTEINQLAANVKATYEVVQDTVQFEDMNSTMDVFNISLFNVTEKIYVVIKNNINNEEKIITSNDATEGVASFKWDYAEAVTNFTIQVYTTERTSCPNERYKTIYLTTPRYNEFYDRETCQELTDFYLCQKFVTFSEISEEKFFKQLESYRNGDVNDSGEDIIDKDDNSTTDKVFNFIDDYKWYFVGGTIVVLVVIIIIFKLKGRKQRDLGL